MPAVPQRELRTFSCGWRGSKCPACGQERTKVIEPRLYGLSRIMHA